MGEDLMKRFDCINEEKGPNEGEAWDRKGDRFRMVPCLALLCVCDSDLRHTKVFPHTFCLSQYTPMEIITADTQYQHVPSTVLSANLFKWVLALRLHFAMEETEALAVRGPDQGHVAVRSVTVCAGL